jgi:PII-like signaling protein
MRDVEDDRVRLRLILSESRTVNRRSLVRALVELLRDHGLAGATVIKGIAGFGHDREVQTIGIEVAAVGLPVVIEAVDTQAHVERVLPMVEALMAGHGVVMLVPVRGIRYAKSPPERSDFQ